MSRGNDAYGERFGIPRPWKSSSYSIDRNLLGRSIEAGLEDPSVEPQSEIYLLTKAIADTPDQPEYVELALKRYYHPERRSNPPVKLIAQLNQLVGNHGVGRIDMVETA